MSPSPPDAPPTVAGLDLRERVGEGSAGVVYRATHLALGRVVAVKVVPHAAAGAGRAVEPRLMAALAHPHVVAVYDAGDADGHHYLVMEYMAGGALRGRMAPGRPWPLARAAAVLDQIAAALDHIHGQGVLHLDLKPENVLYAADGTVKVSDFGLAAPAAGPGAAAAGGRPAGTLDYAAPEGLAGWPPDPRYDVFALATIAYELLTGRLPGRVYVPASRRNPKLPPAVDEVLRRGLARDPGRRYESAAAFRDALAVACRPATRRRVWVTAAGALLVAAVAVGLIVAGRKSLPPPPPPPPLAERPTRLWVLYDQPDDLTLFEGEPAAERVRVETPPQRLPPDLPLPLWPAPRPVLVVRSATAWGFVHPFHDRALARRVVEHWPELLGAVVPPERNFVAAGGFDGDCLAADHRGDLWRVGDTAGWDENRRIDVDRSADPALRLSSLDPARQALFGAYQPLARGPAAGAVVVLRFRARGQAGTERLAVYAGLPLDLGGNAGPAAARVRGSGKELPPEPRGPADGWVYRCPAWVAPGRDWQTYLVVTEVPPFEPLTRHRNLVVDLAGGGRAWVDDVELFAWQPGGAP